MALTVLPTPYGRAAAEALRAEVSRAKQGEPLAPVTVLVPTNSVGVAARRLLASGALGPVTTAGRGVVGVAFLTVYRLAELLAAPSLAAAGRRPVSTPVVGAAVRRVLAQAPGVFAPVATHPATEEALVAAHRELADLGDAALDTLAGQGPRASDVVRIHREARALLAPRWYDEQDLMRTAVEEIEAGSPLLRDLGTVVCHLPQRLAQPAARLVVALSQRLDVRVVCGLTGVAGADATVLATLGRLGTKIDDDALDAISPAHGTAIVTTSDADDEVRTVVRAVIDAMRAGVPLERMAVLFSANEPYARLLHEHLDLAGIAHNGAAVRTLHDSVLGAALLRLFALPDDAFRRDDVFALLASVPVLDGKGRPVPFAPWERISRKAGIVAGVDEWRTRLARYGDDIVANERIPGRSVDWAERERARAAHLAAFVDTLASDVDPARVPASWAALVRWAHGLIRRYLGDDRRRSEWPVFEQEAARRVESALDRLSGLDTVEAAPTLEVFRRTLELELAAARDQVGRLGEGLLVGSVGFALGVDLDRVFVCGLAEGVFPAPPRDDPLLADAERIVLNGELPLRAERVDDDHRALLAALASTAGERVLCFPRGDLRRTTERVPSRFLIDTVEVLTGTRPSAEELARTDGDWYRAVASFVHGVSHAEFPATEQEHNLRWLQDPTARQGAAGGVHPLYARAPALAHGVELVRARRSDAFTRFDGNLAHLADRMATRSPAASGVVSSATRLQTWAACPHAYFVSYLLHVQPVERPEEIEQLLPLDRGSLVHVILDRLFGELLARPAGAPWGDAERTRLHEITDEECAAAEARGVTGRRLLWERDRRVLHAELEAFLAIDSAIREAEGSSTLATELRFGFPAAPVPAVEVTLSDGRTVRFRGSADRVDRAPDGALVVIDYKTGSSRSYKDLSAEDPVGPGTLLQLPVYAHAARAVYGPELPVTAEYWFVGRSNGERKGYEVDGGVEAIFDGAVRAIVDGIEGGLFPAQPSVPSPKQPWVDCAYCDPDGLGTRDRWQDWQRKQHAPELVGFLALAGIGEPVDTEPAQLSLDAQAGT